MQYLQFQTFKDPVFVAGLDLPSSLLLYYRNFLHVYLVTIQLKFVNLFTPNHIYIVCKLDISLNACVCNTLHSIFNELLSALPYAQHTWRINVLYRMISSATTLLGLTLSLAAIMYFGRNHHQTYLRCLPFYTNEFLLHKCDEKNFLNLFELTACLWVC